MVRLILADVEADGLTPSKIHFIRVKMPSTGFAKTFFDMKEFASFAKEEPTKWVFHNGLGYDVWVINRLVEPNLIDPKDIVDTLVVSKLINYTDHQTHSLKELGIAFGVHKGDYTGDWNTCTPEMIAYGEQDVEVLEVIFNRYKKYIYDKDWSVAMRVEHDMAIICSGMSQNGFAFDSDTASAMLNEITADLKTIEGSFEKEFPPNLVEVNRIKYREKQNGELYKNVAEAIKEYPLVKREGGELACFDYKKFNPGSSIDRINVLWEAGWKPTEMTKGYKKFLRDKRS